MAKRKNITQDTPLELEMDKALGIETPADEPTPPAPTVAVVRCMAPDRYKTATINREIQKALAQETDYVVLSVGSDRELTDGEISELVKKMESWRTLGAITCAVKHWHQFTLPSTKFDEPPFVGFHALIVRAAAFKEVGLLDEHTFPYDYGHDIDFTHRLRDKGWEVRIERGIEVNVSHEGLSYEGGAKAYQDTADGYMRNGLTQKYGNGDPNVANATLSKYVAGYSFASFLLAKKK